MSIFISRRTNVDLRFGWSLIVIVRHGRCCLDVMGRMRRSHVRHGITTGGHGSCWKLGIVKGLTRRQVDVIVIIIVSVGRSPAQAIVVLGLGRVATTTLSAIHDGGKGSYGANGQYGQDNDGDSKGVCDNGAVLVGLSGLNDGDTDFAMRARPFVGTSAAGVSVFCMVGVQSSV